MIVKVLEYNKFEVVDNTSLGATKINREAIINGETDIYPDYTGNGAFFLESDYSEDTWKKSSTAYDVITSYSIHYTKLYEYSLLEFFTNLQNKYIEFKKFYFLKDNL